MPKKAVVWGLLSLLLPASAGILAFLAHQHVYLPFDPPLARWMQSLHFVPLDWLLRFLSLIGERPLSFIIVVITVVVLLLLRRRVHAAFVALTLTADLTNMLAKALVGRPRPTSDLVRVLAWPDETSFPSGHATHLMVFWGFLLYLVTTQIRSQALRRGLQGVLWIIILLTGPSRVYLGAHWPSDILGGYLVGGTFLVAIILAYRRWGRWFSAPRHSARE